MTMMMIVLLLLLLLMMMMVKDEDNDDDVPKPAFSLTFFVFSGIRRSQTK